jgi:threonine dehydrogenase-like Zn-dependent dehydrogenase
MKALVYTNTLELQYREEPMPAPVSGEALIQIEAVGICGSDMHAYHGHDARRVPPLILGHEAVGVVQNGRQKGKRVVLNPLITCGHCNHCQGGRSNLCAERELIGMIRAGAFAEYINIPERNLLDIPQDMDSTLASLTEPAATSLHAIYLAEKILHRPLSECRALVIGGGSIEKRQKNLVALLFITLSMVLSQKQVVLIWLSTLLAVVEPELRRQSSSPAVVLFLM